MAPESECIAVHGGWRQRSPAGPGGGAGQGRRLLRQRTNERPSDRRSLAEFSPPGPPGQVSDLRAGAGVPSYWIVNLRDHCVEVYRNPDRFKSEYRSVTRATGQDILTIGDFPDVRLQAAEFLPPAE